MALEMLTLHWGPKMKSATKVLSLLASSLPVRNIAQTSATHVAALKSKMKHMRAQMARVQALMRNGMAKMAAAHALTKAPMETENADMKSQIALHQAMLDHTQTMADQMLAVSEHLAMTPAKALAIVA